MARTNRLDTIPGLRETIAELAIAGHTQEQIAAALAEPYPALDGLHKGVVKRWLKDAKVQAIMERLGRERTNMITRTLDAELFARISDPGKRGAIPTRELIEIRRELLPPPAQRHILSRGVDEGAASSELWLRLSENPEAARLLGMGTLPELEAGDDDELEGVDDERDSDSGGEDGD